jgi:DNA topoisomerase-1
MTDAAGNRSVYPALDLEWAPVPKNSRASHAIKAISDLAKNASSFVHACDYDQEGEVIGYNILEYACGAKYARSLRAKFSTLTEEEIRESFAKLRPPSSRLAEAGRSRHLLDFLYGVNLSRALAHSFKSAARGYRNLSIGRVQGPTLAFAVDREFQIRLHLPVPYWTIVAQFSKDGKKFAARYFDSRIESLADARRIMGSCETIDGIVDDVKSNKVVLQPPTPFNTGDLQREAYRLFRISPGYTLAIAEKLYLQAMISYPRTSSQKLPPSIGYAKVISGLSRIGSYGRLASLLLSKTTLVPNEGGMTDPAHPAIYPTGVSPRRRLDGLEFKIYDLIVKRFLATFGDPSSSLHTDVAISILEHRFKAEGSAPLYEGWMIFYKPYVTMELRALPTLQKADEVKNLGIEMEEKFTAPPRRYNQSSLLAKMEQEQIGTKATRADIIETLFKRNYLTSTRGVIEATELGLAVIESMDSFVPAILSTDLTRSMEKALEGIEQGSANSSEEIERAVRTLVDTLSVVVEKESEIGSKIGEASVAVHAQTSTIGKCPACNGGQLRIIISRSTKKRFVGCSNYTAQGCKASSPLPQRGAIRATGTICKECGWPVIGVVFARRAKQWKICANFQCPAKSK